VAEIDKEEARMEGIEKGKFEVARSMLADGLPAEMISKYTGLDESSILSPRLKTRKEEVNHADSANSA
jgi:predicted transposase/invertase (TIGR01784 family)